MGFRSKWMLGVGFTCYIISMLSPCRHVPPPFLFCLSFRWSATCLLQALGYMGHETDLPASHHQIQRDSTGVGFGSSPRHKCQIQGPHIDACTPSTRTPTQYSPNSGPITARIAGQSYASVLTGKSASWEANTFPKYIASVTVTL